MTSPTASPSLGSEDSSSSDRKDVTRLDLRVRGHGAATRVVVIGGGYAGSRAALKISREFPTYEVVLIDSKDYFENTIAVLSCLTHVDINSSVQAAMKIVIRHDHYLGPNTRVIKELVREVTPTKVILSTETIYYDYLVLACGTSYRNAIKAPNLTTDYRVQALSKDATDLAGVDSVLVVGGGLVGVELAAEIISRYPKKHITLATSGDRLLERMKPSVSHAAHKWLTSHGVTVLYGEQVRQSKRDPKVFRLPNLNASLTPDKAYWCTGFQPNSELLVKHFPDSIADNGYVKVTSLLQMEGTNNVFVIGDLADLAEEKLAERAAAHASYIVKVLKAWKKETTPKPYKSPSKPAMIVISLGPDEGLLCTKRKLTAQGSVPASIKRWAFRAMMMKARKGGAGSNPLHSPGSRLSPEESSFNAANNKVGFIGHYNSMTADLTSVLIKHGSEVHAFSAHDVDVNLADQLVKLSPTLIKSHRVDPKVPNTILTPMRGIQTVIYPFSPLTPHDPVELLQTYLDALRTLAHESSLKHLVVIHPGYLLEKAPLKSLLGAKMLELEEIVHNIDPALMVTIVRYATPFESLKIVAPAVVEKKCFHFPMPKQGFPYVAAEDVRDALITIMARPEEFGNQVYSIAGDFAVSPEEVAAAITRVTGNTITSEIIPSHQLNGEFIKLTNAKIAPLWIDWYKKPKHLSKRTEDLEMIIGKPSITIDEWLHLNTHLFV